MQTHERLLTDTARGASDVSKNYWNMTDEDGLTAEKYKQDRKKKLM